MSLSAQMMRRPHDDWTCAGSQASDFNYTPDVAKVEAVMMLARMMRDGEGKVMLFDMPPALAVAIVTAFMSGDPVRYVLSQRP